MTKVLPLVLLILTFVLAACCKTQVTTQSQCKPQSELSDLSKVVSIALSRFATVRKGADQYKVIRVELKEEGKPLWKVTFKPAHMIPDGSESGVAMGLGGEVFVIVNLETQETEVMYGE